MWTSNKFVTAHFHKCVVEHHYQMLYHDTTIFKYITWAIIFRIVLVSAFLDCFLANNGVSDNCIELSILSVYDQLKLCNESCIHDLLCCHSNLSMAVVFFGKCFCVHLLFHLSATDWWWVSHKMSPFISVKLYPLLLLGLSQVLLGLLYIIDPFLWLCSTALSSFHRALAGSLLPSILVTWPNHVIFFSWSLLFLFTVLFRVSLHFRSCLFLILHFCVIM